jgi:hypothetical protein
MEAWDFLVAGGGLFNNLDYSFTVGHEDGTFAFPPTQPGGGGVALRRQIRHLRELFAALDFIHMRPEPEILRATLPAGCSARVLAQRGADHLVYVRSALLPQQFSVRWSGALEPPASGDYTLRTVSNDGVRLWIDERLVIDNWTEHSVTEDKADLRLERARRHALKLEFFYSGGEIAMKLLWSGPGVGAAPVLVPSSALKTAEGKPGLWREDFADKTLSARVRAAVDPQVAISGPGGERAARHGPGAVKLELELPEGSFRAGWFDTQRGETVAQESFQHGSGTRAFSAPAFEDDIALRVQRAR